MRTVFYIVCRLRTAAGFEAYGSFDLGDDRSFANHLFGQLRGREVSQDSDMLQLDLMETREGLPVNLRVISCTADELAANCKCITKEIFRRLNIDSKSI